MRLAEKDFPHTTRQSRHPKTYETYKYGEGVDREGEGGK